MEKIGLVNDLALSLVHSWEAHQLAGEAQEVKKHHEALAETLAILKGVPGSKDIKLALAAEEMMLRQELTFYSNSAEETNSIKKALEQVQEAKESFRVVENHQTYKEAASTYSSSKKEADLPIDSFRDFLKSHSTRLTNRMTAQISVPEKNIIRQRKENLGMMREVYIGMQREALGMAPEQSKGLGR